MKFIYNAKPNPDSDDTEGHIRHSLLKLGHEVAEDGDGDIYLFHKTFDPPKGFTGKYVCWYFDKVWRDRVIWMEKMVNMVSLVAMTDETWAMKNGSKKIAIIRQGIGDRNMELGEPGRFKAKIVFTGSVYGERKEWVDALKQRYGKDFQVFNNVHNRDLYDLCAAVPIIIALPYPSDDYYWSNRIYLVMGSGGFMIHPRLKGLGKEYLDGEHYVGYTGIQELFQQIDYYLRHPAERYAIQERGYLLTTQKYNFTERTKKLVEEIRKRKLVK